MMKNYFITVNPNPNRFIRKQRGFNLRMGLGFLLTAGAIAYMENQIIVQQNRIADLESRVRELECEKTD